MYLPLSFQPTRPVHYHRGPRLPDQPDVVRSPDGETGTGTGTTGDGGRTGGGHLRQVSPEVTAI